MVALIAADLGRGPDLVLLHGVGLGPDTFLALAEDLATDHHVLLLHRPGSGEDAMPLEEQAAAVAETLAGRADGPAEVVGVSGGATLALALAMCNPEVVDGLVVHEPLVGPLAPALHRRFQAAAVRAALGADEALEVVRELIGADTWDRLPASARADVVASAFWARGEIPMFAAFAPGSDDLRSLGVLPLLVTVGARSGPERHEAAAVLAELAGAAILTIPGSGNAVQLDAPARFGEAVRARSALRLASGGS